MGLCEAPRLPTVHSFFTKTSPWKVYTTSKCARLFSLHRIFSDLSFLKSEEFKEIIVCFVITKAKLFYGSKQENFESVVRHFDQNRVWLRQFSMIHSLKNLVPWHIKLLGKKLFNMFLAWIVFKLLLALSWSCGLDHFCWENCCPQYVSITLRQASRLGSRIVASLLYTSTLNPDVYSSDYKVIWAERMSIFRLKNA